MKKIVIPFLVSAVLILVLFLLFDDLEQTFAHLLEVSTEQKNIYSLVSFATLVSDVVLPVPSSIVMYSNGFILGFVQGMILSLVSVMIGALFGYYLGRFTSLGLKAKEDQKTKYFISKYGPAAILVSRGIPILSESICIVCGYNKISLRPYLLLNLLGYIPVCLIYAYFGSIGDNRDLFLITFGASLLLASFLLIIGKKFLKAI